MKKEFLIVILFLGALALQGDPLYWPTGPRVPAKMSEIWVRSEGGVVRNLRLNINGTNLDLAYMGGFAVGSGDPRWNASLVIPEQPAIRCGFTIFDGGTWMSPGVTNATIQNYTQGLKVKGASDITDTADGTFSDDAMILNYKPEVVDYTLGNSHFREYFVDKGSKVLVFTYEAPVRLFHAQEGVVRWIFGRVR